MKTVFLLLAEYETQDVPLALICEKYFGMKEREAIRKASLQQLPVPAYRCGSQRSPYLVNINDLAAYVDTMRAQARKDHEKMNNAA